MKRIVQISDGNNTVKLKQKDGVTTSFFKIYDSRNKLLRHSRSSGGIFHLTGEPGKYIVESDGEFEIESESNRDLNSNFKKIYGHLDIDRKNNLLTLKGIPFYQTDNLESFIGKMVPDKRELQGYFEAQFDRKTKIAKDALLKDTRVFETLAGVGTPGEQNKIRKSIRDLNKERKRLSVALKSANTAKAMLKITPKFEINIPD